MDLRLRVCGRPVLRCGHPCMEKAGVDHICICNRKWTYDPGCRHLVSGNCSDFTNLRPVCTEICGKPLSCGHSCSQPCSSNDCFCVVCFQKLSIENTNKKRVDFTPGLILNTKFSKMAIAHGASAEPRPGPSKMSAVAGSSARLRSGSSKMSSIAGSSARPRPGPSKMSSVAGSSVRSRSSSSKRPASAGPYPGSSKKPALARPSSPSFEKSKHRKSLKLALHEVLEKKGLLVPQPINALPQHELNQVQKLIQDAAMDQSNPSTSDMIKVFKRCVNDHVFFATQDRCPVCGCPGHGPNFGVVNVTVTIPDIYEMDPEVRDDSSD